MLVTLPNISLQRVLKPSAYNKNYKMIQLEENGTQFWSASTFISLTCKKMTFGHPWGNLPVKCGSLLAESRTGIEGISKGRAERVKRGGCRRFVGL